MPKIPRIHEKTCIDICEKIIGERATIGKAPFDFLKGDKGTKLTVDAYFPKNKIVVEYMGKQHYEDVQLMNRREGRKEQRKRYDNLKEIMLREHGIKLIRIKFDEELNEDNLRRILKKECLLIGIK